MRTVIFASGQLGSATIAACFPSLKPLFIATDSNSVDIIEFASTNGIPLFIGNPRGGRLFSFASKFQIDVILSINYLFILDEDVINVAQFAINFHGSLLPKYRGRTPHVWAIINNEVETGISAHLMDAGCDTGDLVVQEKVEIEFNDTGASILEKFKLLYPRLVFKALNRLHEGDFNPIAQDHALATYFGKRTSEDGQIDWNWQKERIRNWVRAQAFPYPGAFSYIDGKKIVIDEIRFNEAGFSSELPNGTIVQSDPFIQVKTPNGIVDILQIRENKEYCLINKIFRYED